MNVDEDTAENICRALGSDHADPPDKNQHMTILRWQFQVPGNASQQPFHPPPQPPPRHPDGGGGRGGGGGGGGGDGGGGGGLPAPAGPGLFPPHGRAPDCHVSSPCSSFSLVVPPTRNLATPSLPRTSCLLHHLHSYATLTSFHCSAPRATLTPLHCSPFPLFSPSYK
jgi:hypothetical protein